MAVRSQSADQVVSTYTQSRAFERRFWWEDMNYQEAFLPTGDLSKEEVRNEVERISKTTACRFCGAELAAVTEFQVASDVYVQEHENRHSLTEWEFTALACETCGWWHAKHERQTHSEGKRSTHWINTVRHEGLLRRFDWSSQDMPVAEIRRHVARKGMAGLHHASFEQLVGAVYRDFFGCDIVHVGGPGDNGVDLWLVGSGTPCLIQCKRRQSDSAVEGVEVVRDLIGSVVLAGARKGHLVTSARAFSAPARKAAAAVGLVERNIEIELVDRSELFHMLLIANRAIKPYWAELAESARNKIPKKSATIPSPIVIFNRRKKSNPSGGTVREPGRVRRVK